MGEASAFSCPPPPTMRAPMYLNILIYFLKRKFSENILQIAPNCTINKYFVEYVPIRLNIVRNKSISIIFLYKKSQFYNFLGQNCSKIYSKTHQIAPFKKLYLWNKLSITNSKISQYLEKRWWHNSAKIKDNTYFYRGFVFNVTRCFLYTNDHTCRIGNCYVCKSQRKGILVCVDSKGIFVYNWYILTMSTNIWKWYVSLDKIILLIVDCI